MILCDLWDIYTQSNKPQRKPSLFQSKSGMSISITSSEKTADASCSGRDVHVLSRIHVSLYCSTISFSERKIPELDQNVRLVRPRDVDDITSNVESENTARAENSLVMNFN